MYYEDKWDGDELVYRSHPQGEWKPVPRSDVLRRLRDTERKLVDAIQALNWS